MSESQQKAFFLLAKFGDFGVRSKGIPTPGPGELLVKNGAVALNPLDWMLQKHEFGLETFPAVLGFDLAGTVEALGEGVTGFQKGDRVVAAAFWTERQAAFQEYTIASAKFTAKVPQSISIEQASTISVGADTAAMGLYQAGQYGAGLVAPWAPGGQAKYSNKPLVVLGGASSVGAYVIQFAKLSGFSPIIATASLHNAAYLESLGATHVLDRHLDAAALQKEVTSISTLPIDLIYDAISEPDTQKLAYALLADGGTLILTMPSGLGETAGGKIVKFVRGSPFMEGNDDVGEGLYASLHGYLDSGAIQPNRVELLPGGLSGIVAGLERLREGKVSGAKLVVRPQETA
ncbi:GroES-like protein [Athelia psychrophila]|uniref:GroES-like protein n=1 Tax=Athelia psychrophila TaxID=1759441 RepID=A0A166CNL4_9AGAM|nr:GroES-like protein [Fibularhizoctonia sp. CBS 109695]